MEKDKKESFELAAKEFDREPKIMQEEEQDTDEDEEFVQYEIDGSQDDNNKGKKSAQMEDEDISGGELFAKLMNEVIQITYARCKEIGPVSKHMKVGIPNMPNQLKDPNSKELLMIEYTNTVKDMKLRMEAQVLRLQVGLKRQQLASAKAARAESEEVRNLSGLAKRRMLLEDARAARMATRLEATGRHVAILEQLKQCQAALKKRRARSKANQAELKALRAVWRPVRLSVMRLTRAMRRQGFATPKALAEATEAAATQADQAKSQLVELRKHAAFLEKSAATVVALDRRQSRHKQQQQAASSTQLVE